MSHPSPLHVTNFRGRGLTLIELLATTALSAILMTTLLQVVVVTGRAKAQMQDASSFQQDSQRQLAGQINADLSAAQSVRWSDEQLVIEGWGGWDRQTREPRHEPAVVVYRLLDTGTSQTLIRTQRDVLDLGQQRPAACVLAWDVVGWGIGNERVDAVSNADTLAINTNELGVEAAASQTLMIEFSDGDSVTVPIPHDLQIDMGDVR